MESIALIGQQWIFLVLSYESTSPVLFIFIDHVAVTKSRGEPSRVVAIKDVRTHLMRILETTPVAGPKVLWRQAFGATSRLAEELVGWPTVIDTLYSKQTCLRLPLKGLFCVIHWFKVIIALMKAKVLQTIAKRVDAWLVSHYDMRVMDVNSICGLGLATLKQ